MITGTNRLRLPNRILDAPFGGDSPGLDGVEVLDSIRCREPVVRRDAPDFLKLRPGRLNAAPFVRAARLQHGLFTVPFPGKAKSCMSHAKHRLLELRFLPGLPTVDRYVDFSNGARSGPRQTADLVKSAAR